MCEIVREAAKFEFGAARVITECKSYRSQNTILVANIGFDAAENGRLNVCATNQPRAPAVVKETSMRLRLPGVAHRDRVRRGEERRSNPHPVHEVDHGGPGASREGLGDLFTHTN